MRRKEHIVFQDLLYLLYCILIQTFI